MSGGTGAGGGIEGWYADPAGRYAARYYLGGLPTAYVFDGSDVVVDPLAAEPTRAGAGTGAAGTARAGAPGSADVPRAGRPRDGDEIALTTGGPRASRVAVVTTVCLLLAAAAGLTAAVVVSMGPSPAASHAVGPGRTPADVVLTAADTATQAPAAEIDMTMSVTGLPAGVTFTGYGSGVVDWSDASMRLSESMTISGAGGASGASGTALDLQEVVAGGRYYVSIPAQLSAALDGAKWVLVPGSKITSASFGTGEDPAATLQLLRQEGNSVEDLGPMRFDGLPAEDYEVTFDLSPASLQRQLAAEHVPASLQQTELQSLSLLRNATLYVWVSHGRLIGMAEVVSADLPGAPDVSMTIDIDLTYRDKPVAIAAPRDGVVSWQQLQEASASQPAATASS